MIEVIPFKAEHMLKIDIQESQKHIYQNLSEQFLERMEMMNSSFTLTNGETVLACFGWLEFHQNRAQLWSVLSCKIGCHMVAFTRIASRLINALPHKRVEAEVDATFDAGMRWMRMLGLECETSGRPLKSHSPNGNDTHIYAKVK